LQEAIAIFVTEIKGGFVMKLARRRALAHAAVDGKPSVKNLASVIDFFACGLRRRVALSMVDAATLSPGRRGRDGSSFRFQRGT